MYSAAATYNYCSQSGGKPCIILQAMSCVCCVWRSFQKGDHFFANIQAMQKKTSIVSPLLTRDQEFDQFLRPYQTDRRLWSELVSALWP